MDEINPVEFVTNAAHHSSFDLRNEDREELEEILLCLVSVAILSDQHHKGLEDPQSFLRMAAGLFSVLPEEKRELGMKVLQKVNLYLR